MCLILCREALALFVDTTDSEEIASRGLNKVPSTESTALAELVDSCKGLHGFIK